MTPQSIRLNILQLLDCSNLTEHNLYSKVPVDAEAIGPILETLEAEAYVTSKVNPNSRNTVYSITLHGRAYLKKEIDLIRHGYHYDLEIINLI